jgi:hypothetical protein
MNTPFPPVRRVDRSAAGPDGRGRVFVSSAAVVLAPELLVPHEQPAMPSKEMQITIVADRLVNITGRLGHGRGAEASAPHALAPSFGDTLGSVYRCQERSDALSGFDRELADGLFELNELRRSRSLAEYEPTITNARVLPRRPRGQQRRWCRRARRV